MAMNGYIGINGVSKKIKNIYIGVGGVAKKVTSAYVGVNGVAKKWWGGGVQPLVDPGVIIRSVRGGSNLTIYYTTNNGGAWTNAGNVGASSYGILGYSARADKWIATSNATQTWSREVLYNSNPPANNGWTAMGKNGVLCDKYIISLSSGTLSAYDIETDTTYTASITNFTPQQIATDGNGNFHLLGTSGTSSSITLKYCNFSIGASGITVTKQFSYTTQSVSSPQYWTFWNGSAFVDFFKTISTLYVGYNDALTSVAAGVQYRYDIIVHGNYYYFYGLVYNAGASPKYHIECARGSITNPTAATTEISNAQAPADTAFTDSTNLSHFKITSNGTYLFCGSDILTGYYRNTALASNRAWTAGSTAGSPALYQCAYTWAKPFTTSQIYGKGQYTK